ncbi:protein ALP1-like isoform X2 [Prunus avium]|nr:protein ALP1-like isoform X2 [Prunus avium]XP_021821640.1 protein ALP1-like isoform X2 [Prunus avium]
MADMNEVLERQMREFRERRHRQASGKRAQIELDMQIVTAVAMLDEENQRCRSSREGRDSNVDRHRHSRGKNLLEDYFIPTSLYSDVDFRRRYRMQSHLFNKVMHDICNYDEYFVQKRNATGNLGLLPEQKFTAVIRMLAYGSYADQVDEIARMRKSTTLESLVRFCDAVETLYSRDYLRRPTPRDLQRLLQKAEARGFPGMVGSIDCMHWQWKNCPIAWQGDYGNRKAQKSIILEAVAGFDTWVWHAFFGFAGSQNDLNVLGQSPVFNEVLRGEAPNITYQINNIVYQNGYYLADDIYPRWTTFVKSIPHPRSQEQKLFATYQEGYRKDVERCFGILQARWAIIRGAARMFDEEVLRSIMMTCIILHNMIVEDEYDYNSEDVYEPDPMNTALTRIYEKPMGPNGEPVQHEPLVKNDRVMTRMIDRYMEMQSSYIHERRQVDLIEHLWAGKGNDGE